MYCGELKDKSPDYRDGHSKGVQRAFFECREEICKEMYKRKLKKVSMYEVCDIIRKIEYNYSKFCDTYGMGLNYLDQEDEDPN